MTSKHAFTGLAAVGVIALLAGACTTAGAGATAPPVAVATLTATAVVEATASLPATSPEASSGDGLGGQATPGSIDPCSLMTAKEASQAMGKTLGAGVSSIAGPDRVCTFKSGLSELKVILAPPAPDTATATAYWDMERSQVPAGLSVKDLSVFDRSAYANGTTAGVSVSALFVISGTTFFDLYCGFPACGETASVAGAQLIVGRLP